MTILPIVWAPDPILKTKCSPVSAVDDTIIKLMDDMLDTMYQAPGVGLAAPQIGVKKRIIVIDCSSDEETISEEGCLSLPGHYANISRPAEVKVSYLDETAENRLIEVSGLLSVCIQHEIDHLNGILFIDHLSSLKRNMILKKMVKAKKERMRDPHE